jgi:hypothetical protein
MVLTAVELAPYQRGGDKIPIRIGKRLELNIMYLN